MTHLTGKRSGRPSIGRGPLADLVGWEFGRLTVIQHLQKTASNRNRRVLAQCKCGQTRQALVSKLKTGRDLACWARCPLGPLTDREKAHRKERKAAVGVKRVAVLCHPEVLGRAAEAADRLGVNTNEILTRAVELGVAALEAGAV